MLHHAASVPEDSDFHGFLPVFRPLRIWQCQNLEKLTRLKSHGSTKPARPFGLGLWSLCGSLKHLFLVPNWLTTSLLDSGIFGPACAELLSNYNSQEWYFAGLPINACQSLMATLSDAWHEASGHCEICKTSGSLRTNIVGRQGPSATQLLKKKKKWDLCIMQGCWLLCQMHLAVTKG